MKEEIVGKLLVILFIFLNFVAYMVLLIDFWDMVIYLPEKIRIVSLFIILFDLLILGNLIADIVNNKSKRRKK